MASRRAPDPAPAPPLLAGLPFAGRARQRLAAAVTALFTDPHGPPPAPVIRRDDGLFGAQSAAWRVHGDVTTMMVGGIAALMLQMLHPGALAGVWDHSAFRTDMAGRLRRTARFIALTTYGGPDEAQAAIDRVARIHRAVSGVTADGTPYRADDPHLLGWVHVTECWSFLAAWTRYGDPLMPAADRDRYFAEMARLGALMGVIDPPASQVAALALIDRFRPELRRDARTAEVAAHLLGGGSGGADGGGAGAAAHALTIRAALDLLPPWAQAMHGLTPSGPLTPLVRAGTRELQRTLRWALG
ncbi:oxygenase MpaB family protein [Sphingomonas changnyeongensis]|uniref:oxygenase MpaB family protein n=1 Tax=Sphingomonas changnyeongensis TaxID=2698679 RepID=UPI00191C4EA4|nr:oxygenase MpaB family protein [Sphingomonas changnyeongensis]